MPTGPGAKHWTVLQRYDDAVRDWDRAIELSDGRDKSEARESQSPSR